PPPKSAKKDEERKIVTSTIETSAPSYAMQQAIKNFPVTLWAYDCGDPCATRQARRALRREGSQGRFEGVREADRRRRRARALRRIDQGHWISRRQLGQRARRSGLPAKRGASQAGGQAGYGEESRAHGATGRGAHASRGRAGAGSAAASPAPRRAAGLAGKEVGKPRLNRRKRS